MIANVYKESFELLKQNGPLESTMNQLAVLDGYLHAVPFIEKMKNEQFYAVEEKLKLEIARFEEKSAASLNGFQEDPSLNGFQEDPS
jgi:hypothetical protein